MMWFLLTFLTLCCSGLFSTPSDLFMLVGERLDIMDFTQIRLQAEEEARQKKPASPGKPGSDSSGNLSAGSPGDRD